MLEFNQAALIDAMCCGDQLFVVQNVKSGPIDPPRLGIAPEPELPEDRRSATAEDATPRDSPSFLRVTFFRALGRANGAFAGLRKPIPAAQTLQFGAIKVSQLLEKAGVVYRVFSHLRRQWAFRPIGFLRAFGQLVTEMFFNERGQAEFGDARETCGNHRIENLLRSRKTSAA